MVKIGDKCCILRGFISFLSTKIESRDWLYSCIFFNWNCLYWIALMTNAVNPRINHNILSSVPSNHYTRFELRLRGKATWTFFKWIEKQDLYYFLIVFLTRNQTFMWRSTYSHHMEVSTQVSSPACQNGTGGKNLIVVDRKGYLKWRAIKEKNVSQRLQFYFYYSE